jgi:hypothetical protein
MIGGKSDLKYIIIKDDDVSYFTSPEILGVLYGDLLEHYYINFSVVPNVFAGTKLVQTNAYYKNEGLLFDPLIPPKYAGRDEHFDINLNDELIRFLNGKNIEVLQHGYAHEKINGRSECMVSDRETAHIQAVSGKRMLEEKIRNYNGYFIPPWNAISREFFDANKAEYNGILSALIYPKSKNIDILSRYYFNEFVYKRNYSLYENLLIMDTYDMLMKYPGKKNYILSDLVQRNKYTLIQNHYYEFVNGWDKVNEGMIAQWRSLCEEILSNENLKIISVSEMFKLIRIDEGRD